MILQLSIASWFGIVGMPETERDLQTEQDVAQSDQEAITPNEWVGITAKMGTSWSIRVKDLGKGDGVFDAWMKLDHQNDTNVKARQSMVLYRIRCKSGEATHAQILSMVQFDKEGRQLGNQTGAFSELPVVPGSLLEAMSALVCFKR